jgi:hypothetical protein
VAIGGVTYAALLWFTARQTVIEIIAMLTKRKPDPPQLAEI